MNKLSEDAVEVEDLGRIEVFRRLRKSRVVIGMDAASGKVTPVRGAAVWLDIAAGRGDEFDPGTVLVVKTRGEAEHLFLLVAETLSRI